MEKIEKIFEDFNERIRRLENGVITDSISHGIVRHYTDWDLYFEHITDTKDGFVMRTKDGEIIGVFPESEGFQCL